MSDREQISPAILREPAPRGTLALWLAGEIDWREGRLLKQAIYNALNADMARAWHPAPGEGLTVVLALEGVTAFHERALDELKAVSEEVLRRGGTVLFTHVRDSVREQLRASRLLNCFSAYAGERPGADSQRSML